jgi:hypothetical protein
VHCGKVPAAGFESPAVGALIDALPTVATLMAACPARFPANKPLKRKLLKRLQTPQGQPTKETSPYGIVPHTS